jgi:HK97 family phage major capsid protein
MHLNEGAESPAFAKRLFELSISGRFAQSKSDLWSGLFSFAAQNLNSSRKRPMSLENLQNQRQTLAKTIHEFADKHADGAWDSETESNWQKLNADYDSVVADIEKAEQDASRQRDVNDRLEQIAKHGRNDGNAFLNSSVADRSRNLLPGDRFDGLGNYEPEELRSMALAGWFQNQREDCEVNPLYRDAANAIGFDLGRKTLNIEMGDTRRFNRIRQAFASYPHAHQGIDRENAVLEAGRFQNALSTAAADGGDHLFSEDFVSTLEMATLAYGGILQVADVIRTNSGEPLRLPTGNDTGNAGRQIGEAAPVGSVDPTFDELVLNAFKYTSDEVLVSSELLEDNATNLIQMLPEMLGERLGRIQNTRGTTGTGTNQAKGIVTAAAQGVTKGGAAITFDEIISLEHAVDPTYRSRPGAGYMLHDDILAVIRKLKDANNNYLWQSGANAGAPDTLNRYPYTINQDMDSTLVAGKKPLLFGSLRHYKMRQVRGIRFYRLTERHRENDQDAFLAFVRSDSDLLVADSTNNPVQYLEMT